MNRQLIGETRTPLTTRPGLPAVYDDEYVRNGVGNGFMLFEPLASRRERRTRQDFARRLRESADPHYPDAERIVLVMDNVNTHSLAASACYAAFPPEPARRLAERIANHYTAKPGSWLDVAAMGIGVLSRQCLNRRIVVPEQMRAAVRAWAVERNKRKATVHWQFTTTDARIKLRHLYQRF